MASRKETSCDDEDDRNPPAKRQRTEANGLVTDQLAQGLQLTQTDKIPKKIPHGNMCLKELSLPQRNIITTHLNMLLDQICAKHQGDNTILRRIELLFLWNDDPLPGFCAPCNSGQALTESVKNLISDFKTVEETFEITQQQMNPENAEERLKTFNSQPRNKQEIDYYLWAVKNGPIQLNIVHKKMNGLYATGVRGGTDQIHLDFANNYEKAEQARIGIDGILKNWTVQVEDKMLEVRATILSPEQKELRTPTGTRYFLFGDSTMGSAHSQNNYSSVFARAVNGPGTRTEERCWNRLKDCKCCTNRYDDYSDPLAWGKPLGDRNGLLDKAQWAVHDCLHRDKMGDCIAMGFVSGLNETQDRKRWQAAVTKPFGGASSSKTPIGGTSSSAA